MSKIDPFYVGAFEHGLIRIYGLDQPTDVASVRDLLGADPLDDTYVTVFDVADLGVLGLVGYLRDGHAVSGGEIEAHRVALEQITGTVVVITSSAFGGVEQILAPRAPMHHVLTLKEEGAVVTFKPLPNEGAKGTIGETPKKKPSEAAMSGRVATIALLVMGLLVWLMIKVGG